MGSSSRAMFALMVACLWASCVPAAPAAQPPFAPTSVWNRALPADEPLVPRSRALVRELRRQLATTAPWVATTGYSAGIYTVPADQPTMRVEVWGKSAMFTNWDDVIELNRQLWNVPLPPDARPADGDDMRIIVHQPSTDTLWEIWGLHRRATGWHAAWGGRLENVSQSDGSFGRFGASATGLSVLGGMIRISELERGRIDHALGFSIPAPRAGVFVPPAARTDGFNLDPRAIPEGTHFRLDPKLDIDALELPRAATTIAKAVQRYGMVLRDKGGCICFYAEDPWQYRMRTGENPYLRLFDHVGPHTMLKDFPWHRLRVVRPRPVSAVGQ